MVKNPAIVLGARAVVVGSDRQCDVVLPYEGVASHHVCLWAIGSVVHVADLASGVPTRLGGSPVVGRHQAATGAMLELGEAPALRLIAASSSLPAPFRLDLGNHPSLWVRIEDVAGGQRHLLRQGRKTELAYLLATRLIEDRRRALGVDEAGWIGDNELTSELWGPGRAAENSLNVAIFRLRNHLTKRGLPRDLVEKSDRATRLSPRLASVHAALLR